MIYITTMYRYANRESHSYVIYAGHYIRDAVYFGTRERNKRGNKYYPEVMEFNEDQDKMCVYSELDDMCISKDVLKLITEYGEEDGTTKRDKKSNKSSKEKRLGTTPK